MTKRGAADAGGKEEVKDAPGDVKNLFSLRIFHDEKNMQTL